MTEDKWTAEDKAAGRQYLDRRKGRKELPSLKVETVETGLSVGWDHPRPQMGDVMFANALNLDDAKLAQGLSLQLARSATRNGTLKTEEVNVAISIVRGIAPRDALEALVATQMAAIHLATMHAAHYLTSTDTLPQQDSAGNLLIKLARTFAGQVDTLKRYRSTGEQSIRVQHVTVNDGGQAIVGNVSTGEGGNRLSERQPHELEAHQTPSLTHAQRAALFGNVETNETAVQSSSGERLDGLPFPRSSRRSPKRKG